MRIHLCTFIFWCTGCNFYIYFLFTDRKLLIFGRCSWPYYYTSKFLILISNISVLDKNSLIKNAFLFVRIIYCLWCTVYMFLAGNQSKPWYYLKISDHHIIFLLNGIIPHWLPPKYIYKGGNFIFVYNNVFFFSRIFNLTALAKTSN